MPVPSLKSSKAPGAKDVLGTLKSEFGIKTIVRYYDLAKESIPCKTLHRDEAAALIDAGFSVAVVFQHRSSDPNTYIDSRRGAGDARRALLLAQSNGQPLSSVIYFGVDGAEVELVNMKAEFKRANGGPMSEERKAELKAKSDGGVIIRYEGFLTYYRKHFRNVEAIDERSLLPYIKRYFRDVNAEFRRARTQQGIYKIGAYGSGLVCRELLKDKLASYCWLANAMSWPQSKEFADERVRGSYRWSLAQAVPTKCPEWSNPYDKGVVEFDLNRTNPAIPDFGQWSTMRSVKKVIPPLATCRSRSN